MPFPRAVARFNIKVTNRVANRFAGRTRGYGIIEHVGRTSGKRYRTPVNLFRSGPRYVIALTYGPDSEWVRNIQAAGGVDVLIQGRHVWLTNPQVVHDPTLKLVSWPARIVLRLVNADNFLTLEPA